MHNKQPKKPFIVSALMHAVALAVLVVGFDHAAPIPVFENTSQQDVISAVILGDTVKSKILPPKKPEAIPTPVVTKLKAKIKPKVVAVPKKIVKKKKAKPKKKKVPLKVVKKKKYKPKKNLFSADNLLADINKINKKSKRKKQKELKKSFQKTLREQSEASLRQQLFEENIKLSTERERRAQGEVNKYKALIIQTISENWIVPSQANKKLYSELMIRVAPGGVVLDVQITKSSGDPSLDRSAKAAVLKSSPLPVPKNSDAFKAFRRFVLKVRPENIVNG